MRYMSLDRIRDDSAIFPAHIRKCDNGFEIQTVEEHSVAVADYAKHVMSDVGLGQTAYLCGLLHDMGKLSDEYKKYLVDVTSGKDRIRGSVNHTFAGVRYIIREYHDEDDRFIKIAAEFAAYVIGSHHGIFDCVTIDDKNGFEHRLHKADPSIDKAIDRFKACHDKKEIDKLIFESANEIKLCISPAGMSRDFRCGLIARFILSALIEGDRRDTAEFCYGYHLPIDNQVDFSLCADNVKKFVGKFKADSVIQRCRREISEMCAEYPADGCGIYRLNIPTGGGKTLSSLRFALNNSVKHGKKRIIYVIPLLTVIEQNAKVIRDALGMDGIVLEHHSNVSEPASQEETDIRELMCETWDAPVIITTLYQLLNVLFSHKTTSIRRLHSLSDSVIIFDEVQSVPHKMLSMFNEALHFMGTICRATVVLCSATQPSLDIAHNKLTDNVRDIIPYDQRLFDVFKRTVICNRGDMDTDGIAEFADDVMKECQSLLIVCNTKAIASELFVKLREKHENCFYLSTSMCMQHRRDTLARIEESKRKGKTLCISTQVIEAGVDISFERVIRLTAGLDSIVQAAGRCNRNGESDTPCEVSVINCNNENLDLLSEIKKGKTASIQLLHTHSELEPTSEAAIKRYYDILFNDIDSSMGAQDYYVEKIERTLFKLLSDNGKYKSDKGAKGYYLCQAFNTAGENFTVFDKDSVDVVVSYGDSPKIVERLYSDRAKYDIGFLKNIITELKPYTISVFSFMRDKMMKEGGLTMTPTGVYVLSPEMYDSDRIGLRDTPKYEYLSI